jgi:hypothetical protein
METQSITMTREAAQDLYRQYQKHVHYSKPIDREVMRAYQLLAKGRVVIKALESIVAAGLGPDGWPKLAIARATAKACHCRTQHNGSVIMADTDRALWTSRRNSDGRPIGRIEFPPGAFTGFDRGRYAGIATMPMIPLHLRPQRALEAYDVLWEAEWTMVAPKDPFLLRRIGQSDLWAVVAMWELTEVERAVLSTRLIR